MTELSKSQARQNIIEKTHPKQFFSAVMMSFYVEQICVPTALSTKARCEKDGGLSPTESYYRIHCTISVLRCLKIHTPLPFTFMTALSFSKTNTEMIWMKPSARHIQIDLFRKEISKDASL